MNMISKLRWLSFLTGMAALLGSAPGNAHACASIDLGITNQFTVLGLSNTVVDLSNAQIHGTVWVGPHGDLKLEAPSTIYGNAFFDTTATESISAGKITGKVFTNLYLAPAVFAARWASATVALFPPTLTLGNVTNALTINGNGGTNVINIASLNLNNANLTLKGGSNDLFFINITGGFSLNGTAQIVEAGGAGPY